MTTTMIAGDKQVTVTVRGRERHYESLTTAVHHHNDLRDKSGKGASKWPTWLVECEGERYYISYNGRVWAGLPSEWSLDTVEVVVPK